MAYDTALADAVRSYLNEHTKLSITEKEMFRGLCFMVDDKMCVNISGDNLMCRFDPLLQQELSQLKGYLPMIMKGKEMKGYCYVSPDGMRTKKDLHSWLQHCLQYNQEARSSKKKKGTVKTSSKMKKAPGA